MKIGLIGLSESSRDFFPVLGESLAKKISGAEIVSFFAQGPFDIPAVALEASAESDFLLVFAQIDDESDADFVKKKLVDVELLAKVRILKIVDFDFGGKLDGDFDGRDKSKLIAQEIADLAAEYLFNEKRVL